ncbi:MAG: hypothetical protein ABIH23_00655 [bacterium]
MAFANVHSMSIRIPAELQEAARRLAKKRGLSMNSLIREGLERFVESETRAQWASGFDTLGKNPDLATVEPYFEDQAETLHDH